MTAQPMGIRTDMQRCRLSYCRYLVCISFLLFCCEGNWSSAEGPVAKWNALAVYPPETKLNTAADFQNVIAVAVRDDGITLDVTDKVQWSIEQPGLAKFESFRLTPVADGQTKLRANWEGLQAESTVVVADAAKPRDISFHLDVMPVLTRSGCNTGSCHGAARGKDGFRLSLFGFDPVGDYQRITREIGVRRINLALPDQSLILLKSLGSVPHSGGKRMEPDSEYHRTLIKWLRANAPIDAAVPPACIKVDLFPTRSCWKARGQHNAWWPSRITAMAPLAMSRLWPPSRPTTNGPQRLPIWAQ
jgi:hypothetical protein